jgi:hypothetical protein
MQTQEGYEAQVLSVDEGSDYPLIGQYRYSPAHPWQPITWTEEGKLSKWHPSDLDIRGKSDLMHAVMYAELSPTRVDLAKHIEEATTLRTEFEFDERVRGIVREELSRVRLS